MKRSPGSWAAATLAAPGTLMLMALMIVPALFIFPAAFTDWEFGRGRPSFIGFANFAELMVDARFVAALRNTLVYACIVVPTTIALGLLLALLIDRSGRLKGFYRATHFLPVVATLAAMAVAWDALLHPTFGLLNQVLNLFGANSRNWLRDESLVLPTLAVIGVWHNLGFAIVMFLAGLRTIPRDLMDAASLDGATSPLDATRTVVLPMLGPVTLFVAVITAKKALAVYDTVFVMTKGGPGDASEVLVHLLYIESFDRLRAGYGAAITVVYLALLLTVTFGQRALDRRIHYR